MKPSLQNRALGAAQKQSRQTGRDRAREAGNSSTSCSSHGGNLEGERAPVPVPCWEEGLCQLHQPLGHGPGISHPFILPPAASGSSRDLIAPAPALALLPVPGGKVPASPGVAFLRKLSYCELHLQDVLLCDNFCHPRTQSHWRGTLRLWPQLRVSRSGL